MSNPMETLQQCIEGVQCTRENLNRAKYDHESALRAAIDMVASNRNLVGSYLSANPATVEAVLRYAARK